MNYQHVLELASINFDNFSHSVVIITHTLTSTNSKNQTANVICIKYFFKCYKCMKLAATGCNLLIAVLVQKHNS